MPNPVGSDLIIAMQGCFCNPNRGGRAEGACPQILLLRRGCFLSKKLQIPALHSCLFERAAV